MNLLSSCVLLQLMTPLTVSNSAQHTDRPPQSAGSPKMLVRSLYKRVVARHPLGVPEGENMKILAPYLSKALLHRMDLAIACVDDWHRQNPEPHLKPELGWLELGPFSGDNERASPKSFVVERKEAMKNGSFRVYVKLARPFPGEPPSSWRVAAIVVRENGQFVVDDVIYLKDEELGREYRLSEYLSAGCDGPHWIGFDNQRTEK